MAKERWQPPPMKATSSAKQDGTPSDKGQAKVTVDENVVRKMLKVNPALRQGRTTSQVKKSFERGEPLMSKAGTPAATATEQPRGALPAGASELRDTVSFFLRSKLEALGTKEAEIEARRKALDAELEAAKSTLRDQVKSFLGLLDQSALAQHGAAALAEHTQSLKRVGLDANSLIDAARRAKS